MFGKNVEKNYCIAKNRIFFGVRLGIRPGLGAGSNCVRDKIVIKRVRDKVQSGWVGLVRVLSKTGSI